MIFLATDKQTYFPSSHLPKVAIPDLKLLMAIEKARGEIIFILIISLILYGS